MAKKNEFDGLYQAIRDEMKGVGVAYTRKGNFSVFIKIKNPVEQYSADIEAYYSACALYTSILKTLGDGYALQKQDIYSRQTFHHEEQQNEKFLSKAYMAYFEGRSYMQLETYLIITQELKRSSFYSFDKKKWADFWTKIQKIQDILSSEKIEYKILDSKAITEYLYRYLGLSFRKGAFSYNNFKHMDNYVKAGEKLFKMIDMVDIDEVIMPPKIKPYRSVNGLPLDLFSFLGNVPDTECVIYTQTIIIPNQRRENSKLTNNMNRKKNIPDPANLLAAKDIENVIHDIAVDNRLLVYTNYTVMIAVEGDEQSLNKAFNYVEKQFYDNGIAISKNAYNQLELFINCFPGNAFSLENYERFLCLHDTAVSFMAKERIKTDEDTPIKIYYTDRQGVPVAVDVTGKEGEIKYTTNSNFFSLGPSGSGKSFHMNSVVRQLHEQETDIVLVDTGNSYEGLCEYFNGRYISYTEEKPITMNPFFITREENNIEKQNFLKSLILLIWKGADGEVTKIEDGIIEDTINTYYEYYFTPFNGFNETQKKEIREMMILQDVDENQYAETEEHQKEREAILDKVKKLESMADGGEGGEVENSKAAIAKILYSNGMTREELEDPENYKLKKINKEITSLENRLKKLEVKELNFNSFYNFSIRYIPILCKRKGISFNMKEFAYLLGKFYKGGKYERTLNDNMEGSLLDETFIVFEIDAIKDDPVLFPITTLIIMDVFIQKMRLKKNRKALIIEEAWKAIASPMMAGYIQYLYKTVRKFWGIVGVVTQELNDIISNDTVKEAIINNSEIIILLDQIKFKERYDEIAKLLGLSEVELRKIWTINQLDNKEGRSYFKEVYIRRGSKGDVFGVEESPESYMAYTTERIEKDALKIYIKRYGNYEDAIIHFCQDWKKACGKGSKADKYAAIVSKAVKEYNRKYGSEKEAIDKLIEDWKNSDVKENVDFLTKI
jgi:energy-coupling factor transporter ATP-binding protein EcfA2